MPALLDCNQLRIHECDGNISVMSDYVTLGTYGQHTANLFITESILIIHIFRFETAFYVTPICYLKTMHTTCSPIEVFIHTMA